MDGPQPSNKAKLLEYLCQEWHKVTQQQLAYRRERNIREIYEERFLPDRAAPYPRAAGPVERRPFVRPEEDYSRGGGFEYEGGPRFYPNGAAPRNYHGEEQRPYHGEGHHFPGERRGGPPARREEPYAYRVPREEFSGGRPHPTAGPPPSVRAQGMYPTPRSLSAVVPEAGGDDTLMQAILSLDRGPDDPYRRKAPFPPPRERSPLRREVPRSPHSRSGSSVSSRGYSPDRAKGLPPYAAQQGVEGPEGHTAIPEHLWGALFTQQSGHDTLDKDRLPGLSRDCSPQSTASTTKEEVHPVEVAEREEPPAIMEESQKSVSVEDFQEKRAQAIAAKAREIEKVYRQDCETFGMVVKMLVAKDSALEKQLQVPLRENLGEIRERCLEDLKHFITELDEVIRQPDPTV
ncbi:periphilin-1 [Aplochiton taeniatus]